MALTDKQIIAFLELPRIGRKTVEELGYLSTEFIDDRQNVSGCLSGSCLCAGDDVFSFKNKRYGLFLHRGCLLKIHRVKSV